MKSTPPPLNNQFKFDCPSCGQHISADSSMAGTTQTCPTCSQVFQVPWPRETEGEPAADTFFAWAERTLMKMILGVPRFMFWVIPREVILFLKREFPWIVRFVRVSILFMIWMAMVFWPFALHQRYRSSIFEWIGLKDHLGIDLIAGWFCWGWLALAISGSFWGIAYTAIRKRRSRKKNEAEPDPNRSTC